jgi:hypothetical protein
MKLIHSCDVANFYHRSLINVGFYLGAPPDIQSMNSAMP